MGGDYGVDAATGSSKEHMGVEDGGREGATCHSCHVYAPGFVSPPWMVNQGKRHWLEGVLVLFGVVIFYVIVEDKANNFANRHQHHAKRRRPQCVPCLVCTVRLSESILGSGGRASTNRLESVTFALGHHSANARRVLTRIYDDDEPDERECEGCQTVPY
ncbi:hypothetical protein HUJ04_001195 [Dendroctonus ponderosae]|nr:hypothetical protein HUJ04_001195 [Dendroctonus ponderosae]